MEQGRPEKTRESAGLTQASAASMLNISERSIQDVKRVEREAPELIANIESGELTLNAAIGEIKKRGRVVDIERQREELEERATVKGGPGGLTVTFAQVEEETGRASVALCVGRSPLAGRKPRQDFRPLWRKLAGR